MKKKKIVLISSITLAMTSISLILGTVAWFQDGHVAKTAVTSSVNTINTYFDGKDGMGTGLGTSENPYLITRPVHLWNLNRILNDSVSYNQLAGAYISLGDFTNHQFYATDDAEYATATTLSIPASYYDKFRPFGINEERSFNCHLIGNNRTINGLTISKGKYVDNLRFYGVFGYVKDTATIKDIDLTSLKINVKNGGSNVYCGFLAGYTENYSTSFSNVNVKKGSQELDSYILNNATINSSNQIAGYPSLRYKFISNYGMVGKDGSELTSDGVGTAKSHSFSTSNIGHNFSNYTNDLLFTRDKNGTSFLETNKTFSNAVSSSGGMASGYSLSSIGRGMSNTYSAYYGSSHTPIPSQTTYVPNSIVTTANNAGNYIYKDYYGSWTFGMVSSLTKASNTYNVFTLKSGSYYLRYPSDYIDGSYYAADAVITDEAPTSSTYQYYLFSLINNSNPNGLSSVSSGDSSTITCKIYCPAVAKYLVQGGSTGNEYYYFEHPDTGDSSTIEGKTITTFTLGTGLNKTISNVGLDTTKKKLKYVSSNPATFVFGVTSWAPAPTPASFAGALPAAGKSDWEKITSASSLADGKKIILVTNDESKYFNGTFSSGHGQATSLNASNPASSSAAGVIELEAVTGGYALKLISSNNYLYASAAKSGSLSTHNSEDSYWRFSYSSSKWSVIYNKNSAKLRSYSNSSFRTYSTDNGAALQIYIEKSGGSTTVTTAGQKQFSTISYKKLVEYYVYYLDSSYNYVDDTDRNASFVKQGDTWYYVESEYLDQVDNKDLFRKATSLSDIRPGQEIILATYALDGTQKVLNHNVENSNYMAASDAVFTTVNGVQYLQANDDEKYIVIRDVDDSSKYNLSFIDTNDDEHDLIIPDSDQAYIKTVNLETDTINTDMEFDVVFEETNISETDVVVPAMGSGPRYPCYNTTHYDFNAPKVKGNTNAVVYVKAEKMEFISDTINNIARAPGTYSSLNNLRYDVIGGGTTNINVSSSFITIVGNSSSYSPHATGTFDPITNCPNSVLVYLDKNIFNTSLDNGTLTLTLGSSSNLPYLVNHLANKVNYCSAVSDSEYAYISFKSTDFQNMAYAWLDSSGNVTTTLEDTVTYVLVLTAANSQTVKISNISYNFSPLYFNYSSFNSNDTTVSTTTYIKNQKIFFCISYEISDNVKKLSFDQNVVSSVKVFSFDLLENDSSITTTIYFYNYDTIGSKIRVRSNGDNWSSVNTEVFKNISNSHDF